MERAGKQGRTEGILMTSPDTFWANQNQNQDPPFVIPPPPFAIPPPIGGIVTWPKQHRKH